MKNKITDAQVLSGILEEKEKELHICTSCLKHEQEKVNALNVNLMHERQYISSLIKQLPPEGMTGWVSLKLYNEEGSKLENRIAEQDDEINIHISKLAIKDSIIHDLKKENADIQKALEHFKKEYAESQRSANWLHKEWAWGLDTMKKLKKDIVMRAVLWSTAGLLAGIAVEMILKLLR